MNIWLVSSAVLAIFTAWYIFKPLFEPLPANSASGSLDGTYGALVDRKERALRALKDLELDYAMGKINEDDFAATNRVLTLEATAILDELSKHGAR